LRLWLINHLPIHKAEKVIFESKSGHEYLPFKGLAEFGTRTAEFAFGKDAAILKEKRVNNIE